MSDFFVSLIDEGKEDRLCWTVLNTIRCFSENHAWKKICSYTKNWTNIGLGRSNQIYFFFCTFCLNKFTMQIYLYDMQLERN